MRARCMVVATRVEWQATPAGTKSERQRQTETNIGEQCGSLGGSNIVTRQVGHADRMRPTPWPPWDWTRAFKSSPTREKIFSAELLHPKRLMLPSCARTSRLVIVRFPCFDRVPAASACHEGGASSVTPVRLLTLAAAARRFGMSGCPSNSTIN